MDIATRLPYIHALPYELWQQIFLHAPDQRTASALACTCKGLNTVYKDNQNNIKLSISLKHAVRLARQNTGISCVSIIKFASMAVLAASLTGPENLDKFFERFSSNKEWGKSLDDFLPDDQLKELLCSTWYLINSFEASLWEIVPTVELSLHDPEAFKLYIQATLIVETWCRLPHFDGSIATLKTRFLDMVPTEMMAGVESFVEVLDVRCGFIEVNKCEELTMLTDKYRNYDYRFLNSEL